MFTYHQHCCIEKTRPGYLEGPARQYLGRNYFILSVIYNFFITVFTVWYLCEPAEKISSQSDQYFTRYYCSKATMSIQQFSVSFQPLVDASRRRKRENGKKKGNSWSRKLKITENYFSVVLYVRSNKIIHVASIVLIFYQCFAIYKA